MNEYKYSVRLSTLLRKEETDIIPSMLVWVLWVLSLLIHVISHVYVYCVCVYSCMLAYQEFVLTLATGWSWGQRATALSYSSGYWIQQPLTLLLLMLSKPVFYITFSPWLPHFWLQWKMGNMINHMYDSNFFFIVCIIKISNLI